MEDKLLNMVVLFFKPEKKKSAKGTAVACFYKEKQMTLLLNFSL